MITVIALSPALDVTYLVATVVDGSIHRPRDVLRCAGGKGLNLARAAVQMGADVTVIAPLGGHIGALVESLAASDLPLIAVPVAALTRTCVTIVADDDGRVTEFYEPNAELSAAESATLLGSAAALPVGGWTVVSGSIAAGVDLAGLVAMLRGRGGDRLAIDTHGAALVALVDELQPALVKVNRHEAAELLGVQGGALELARLLHERTGGAVIVTDGSAGSAAVDVSGQWLVSSSAPAGQYPVGSGDTFLAGILTAFECGQNVAEALMLASTCAAANAAIPGAAQFDPALATALRVHTRVHIL